MRDSAAVAAIPARGADSVPYATHRELAQGLLKHLTESFAGFILGAGGVGGSLLGIPFQPTAILLMDTTTPLLQLMAPTTPAGTFKHVNVATAAAAAVAIPAATKAVDGTWTQTLPTTLAPDGVTVTLLILGFRDVGGSL
jgi:hypothetical protein